MVGVTHMLHNVGAKEGNILFFALAMADFYIFSCYYCVLFNDLPSFDMLVMSDFL